MPLSARSASLSPAAGPRPEPAPLDADALALFEALRGLRRGIAEELNVPAFVVFSDRTLREMARARPRTRAELLAIKGVGDAKCESFGQRFLDVIRSYIAPSTNAREVPAPFYRASPSQAG
ncbi:MAG: HRDC domain-containing protein [Planctomycetota bacterium]